MSTFTLKPALNASQKARRDRRRSGTVTGSAAATGSRTGLRCGAAVAAALLGLGALTACGNDDPLSSGGNSANGGKTLTVGAANFPESEILAELYTQAMQDEGVGVTLKKGIGARDVYLSALEKGDIDLVPEYSGNLEQYYDKDSTSVPAGASSEQVLDAVKKVLPKDLSVGEAAKAESKDSYRVLKTTADQYRLTTLGDLAKLAGEREITIGGNPELAERPYGPKGLSSVYGLPQDKMKLTPISDGGGPLTVAALKDGTVLLADIYTTSPVLDRDGNPVDVVELADPKNMVLPQNVLPLMRTQSFAGVADDKARKAIEEVQSKLTTADLLAMNLRNVGPEKAEPKTIAKDWLRDKGLTK